MKKPAKIGDLVRVPSAKCNGIIVEENREHRQMSLTVLTEHGYLLKNIWFGLVEVINGEDA